MAPTTNPVILTIDDESVIRASIRSYLEDYDYTVLEAKNGRLGLEIFNNQHVDLILVDLRMPEVDGLELLNEVRGQSPDMPVIVVSGTGDISEVVDALRLGAWDYLLKPIDDMSILLHSVEKGLERARLIRDNKNYQERLEERVEQKTVELSQINARLREVVETTKRLVGCGDITECGVLLLEEFGSHMGAAGGSIYRVERDAMTLLHSLDRGHAPQTIELPLDKKSVFGKVLETGEVLYVPDIDAEQGVVASGWGRYFDNSLLVFPIPDRDGSVSVLIALHSKKDPPFLPQDREIGALLASHSYEVLQTAHALAALQKSEERLRQAQKMEAIGTLAGGIAHDFNNILAAIIGYTDLSLYSGLCDQSLVNNLEHVKRASNRARDLVRQILSFGRMEEYTEKAVDISPIIKEVLKLLRATIPSSIEINYNVPSGLGEIMIDPTRIHQVLMNLCTNAAHAMGSQGGVLDIQFTEIEPDEYPTDLENETSPCLRLTVSDTGPGMESEVLDRIFDPYYTTKQKGEGTGLGLAVVQGIVRATGGVVQVESTPGKGSSFHLYFPCNRGGNEVMEESDISFMPTGCERILFVDDEAPLADMVGQMLTRLGYHVTVKTNSSEALGVFTQDPENYDMLITDQTMPEISGVELAKEVLALQPEMPVVLYTGYSTSIDGKVAKQIGIREFMMKPLSMTNLADVVRRVFDSP